MKCEICGYEIESGTNCPYCGSPLPQMASSAEVTAEVQTDHAQPDAAATALAAPVPVSYTHLPFDVRQLYALLHRRQGMDTALRRQQEEMEGRITALLLGLKMCIRDRRRTKRLPWRSR